MIDSSVNRYFSIKKSKNDSGIIKYTKGCHMPSIECHARFIC